MRKFFEIGFKKPKLLGIGENQVQRSATPFELFFDLAFVVAITHLMGYIEYNLNYQNLLYVVLKFITIFIYWNSITMYNQYFEDNTIIHRIIIFFSMIPVLFLSIDDYHLGYNSFLVYILSFMVSRIYVIGIWIWSTYNTQNSYLKKIVRIYYEINILSLIFSLISLLFLIKGNYSVFTLIWIIVILFEIIYPIVRITKVNQQIDFNNPQIPVFDRKLQMERSTLFTILILGEGLVGTAHFINEVYNGNIISLLSAMTLFLITFMILWIYMDYYSSHTVNLSYFLNLNYLNIFQGLGSFLIMGGFITLFDTGSSISQVVIVLGLIFFSITNIIIDKHRGEFILEKYEYSDVAFRGRKFDFTQIRRSFYINIIVAIFLLIFHPNTYVFTIVVILLLFMNIALLVKRWLSYL